MTIIPLFVKTSECQQFRYIYLKNKKFFLNFLCVLPICIKFRKFSEKDDPNTLCIYEITDYETHAKINV